MILKFLVKDELVIDSSIPRCQGFVDLLFKSKIKLEFRFTTCVIKRLGTEMEGFVFIEESKVNG